MAYFSDVGAHCSYSGCGIKDFLPFTCNQCNDTFCLDHFKPDIHRCRNIGMFDARVVVCPNCSVAIRLKHFQEPDAILRDHQGTHCQRQNKPQTKTCPVKGCREQLTITNNFTCKACHAAVCLRHRLPEDHTCCTKPPSATSKTIPQSSKKPSPDMKHPDPAARKKSRLMPSRCSIQ